MAYIYKIVNDINNKIYIGKTLNSIKERWRQHCKDFKKERCEKRPLYDAMNKYGIEHFHIEEVENVIDISLLEEREKYWIKYFNSFKEGYNATQGGDGRPYLNYNLIYKIWSMGVSARKTAEIVGCHEDSVLKILKNLGISSEEIKKHAIQSSSKPVCKIDKDTEEILQVYPSIKEAERQNNYSRNHISPACQGKQKLAFGFKWKFLSDVPVQRSGHAAVC